MKFLLALLLLALSAAAASAQNFGNIPPQSVLGNADPTASKPAQPVPFAAIGTDVKFFGAVGNPATTDDTAAIQAALNAAVPGKSPPVVMAGRAYQVGNLTIPPNVVLDCQVAWGQPASQQYHLFGGLRTKPGTTITMSQGSQLRNCYLQPLGVVFPVQTPAAYAGTAITYAAAAHDTRLSNLLLIGYNTGISNISGGARFQWSGVEMDAVNGFVLGESLDSAWIGYLRTWPFGTTGFPTAPVNSRAGIAFHFTGTGRDDDIKIDNLTDYGHDIGLQSDNPGLACCNLHIKDLWLDINDTRAIVSTTTNTTYGKVMIISNSATPISMTAGSAYIADLYVAAAAGNCASITGGAVLDVGHVQNVTCVANFGAAWTAVTPIITCNTGTVSTFTGGVRYKRTGKSVSVNLDVKLTALGGTPCSGSISFSLPYTAASLAALAGRELASGSMLQGIISGAGVTVAKYDNSPLIALNNEYVLSGVYEAQ
jgi:hypothetical protein